MDFVSKSEEKGSDVNLASHLLRDAFLRHTRCAVIISNDSDLLTPIQIAKADCGTTIGLALPRTNGSVELKRLGNFKVPIRAHVLANAQFPATMTDANGVITKPMTW